MVNDSKLKVQGGTRRVLKGELGVPFREVTLTNGERLDLYETAGPEGHDVRAGLPKLRAPWIAKRAGEANQSQMHFARRGIVTEEMRFVAIRENCAPEFVRSEIAAGRASSPRT